MKKIRLNKNAYFQKEYPCHITICAKGNERIFAHNKFTITCMAVLELLFKQFKMKPLVYCFMPDHIHMIVIVDGDKSIVSFVQAFKSKATIESYRFGFKGKIFQSRFYDRFIGTPKNLENEIKYVMENPIRKGLVEDISEYPYSKCFPANIS